MAIQEIEVSKRGSDKTGFKREIDEGAMGLVLDTIQVTQYTKPEESTVRELTANAVDSQREKEVAIKILSGQAKAEDYFISREGMKYKDSNWDPSYYDLNYLDQTVKNVELKYIQGEGSGYCDKFVIKDHGVGLGGNRLEGYFKIGYSTKRNSKASLGAFGFGNKVALSTRCDYYTVTTAHNGKKFKFNCYSYKIDSLIGKFNLETNVENEFIEFSDGTKIYYEKTDEKNFTEISVPTKRHNRSKYEHAVRAQLLYFPNVDFKIVNEDGTEQYKQFRANIYYNSDRIIVSDNNQFSKPHIVIVKGESEDSTGVCYGFIDFGEMEMQDLWGNVGIKCPIRSVLRNDETGEETVLLEGVEVTPSRESVVWSDHTRNFLIKRFKEAVEEATNLVEKQLLSTDILDWISKAYSVKNAIHYGGDKVLSQLSRVIDTHAINPKFNGTSIRFTNPLTFFRGLNVRFCSRIWNHKEQKNEIQRHEVKDWSNFPTTNVYLKSVTTSTKVDHYLAETVGNFVTIEYMDDEECEKEYLRNSVQSSNLSPTLYDIAMNARDFIYKEIKKSALVKNYDTIVVPDDFGKKVEEAEAKAEELKLSAAEKRKALGKVVVHAMVPNSSYHNAYGSRKNELRPFTFTAKDEVIADLPQFEGEIIYGFSEDTDKLMLLGQILDVQCSGDAYGADFNNPKFYNKEIKVLKISQTNEKYFRNNERFKHVSSFFQKIEDCN